MNAVHICGVSGWSIPSTDRRASSVRWRTCQLTTTWLLCWQVRGRRAVHLPQSARCMVVQVTHLSAAGFCFCLRFCAHCASSEILRFFEFSRWRPSAILDSFGAYLDHPQWVRVGLYHSAKFGYDRCSSFYNMKISIFGTFGWKMPIHAPETVFWAIWSMKWAPISTKAKKGTSLHESVSIEPLNVKMWWMVWPVGEFFTFFSPLGKSCRKGYMFYRP